MGSYRWRTRDECLTLDRYKTHSKRGFFPSKAAGGSAAAAPGWSSSTNCLPAASAWTGTGHPRCCPASTTTASSPAWRDSWTTSSGRSRVRSVGLNIGCPTMEYKDFRPMSPWSDSWNYMQILQESYRIQMQMLLCPDAHCDIMKREISRINNQVKRGLHRIEEAMLEVERNQTQLKSNADQVVTEIEEINRRLTLALKERTDYLKTSVEKYVSNELKSLKDLKDNLDLEITNITSNADLMEKNLDDGTTWDDVELMDCKDIFIKMMDWIRNYDTSNEEYNRKIRFTCHDTVNDLAKRILEIGDLKMQENKGKDTEEFESRSIGGLSRSKSDHRLVSEFRRQEESSPPVRRRAFGESRYNRDANKSRTNLN